LADTATALSPAHQRRSEHACRRNVGRGVNDSDSALLGDRTRPNQTSRRALVTLGVVTVTATLPASSAGETAVIDVAELTVKLVALVAPKLTAVVLGKLVPVMVTVVPPATGLFYISAS
jgi:hypothetical protein